MNRKQAERELAEAEKKIAEVKEYLKENPEDKKIMVPDEIHLYQGEEIIFNNDKQSLYWNWDGAYSVAVASSVYNHEPHHLIPAVKNNLKIGKVYYHSNHDLYNIKSLDYYGIWDGKNFIYSTGDNGIAKTCSRYSTIMQAVPVED